MYTFLNTSFLPAAEAKLHVSDLSIQRGFGVFDYFKSVGGNPVFLDDHLDRFFHSAGYLRLPIPRSREELKSIITELIRLNLLPDSGIRITLTGGCSPDSVTRGEPNLIITQQPLPAPLTEACAPPIRLISYPHQRQLPEAKTIDYLMALHLQPTIRERGASDVLYHHDGIITECPRCNFFLVSADGVLVTPGRNMLKGITRKYILLEAAAAGIPAIERDIRLSELNTGREAFISSTSRHIIPVSHVDDIAIGHAAGPIAAALNRGLYRLVNAGK